MDERVDEFLAGAQAWQLELRRLRELLLECGLDETYKWRAPCYTWEGRNIAIIGSFKAYCVLAFFKGALLKDEAGLLVQQGPNTESSRSYQFTELAALERHAALLRAYVREAVEVERAGITVVHATVDQTPMPEELAERLQADLALKTAYKALTPGRRKAYQLYIGAAKQSKTRAARVAQAIPRILDGKGLHDCVCGLSKRMPACDGSHRQLRSPEG